MNQDFTLSLLTGATKDRNQNREEILPTRSLVWRTLRQSALRLYRFGTMKNGSVAMCLAIALMTLITCLFGMAERTENNGLCQVPSIQNLGLEHFYAAFGLGCSRNLRTSSARALGISENNISEDSSVSIELANSLQPLQHGIPCETYSEESKNYSAEEVQPVAEEMEESSPNGSDSEASSSSQSTSTVAFSSFSTAGGSM